MQRCGCADTFRLDNNVYESCTRMNSEDVLTDGRFAYWTDAKGTMKHGCMSFLHS